MEPVRVYADTSVFGGVFDEHFSQASRGFFGNVRIGLFKLIVSELTSIEIDRAPREVRALLDSLMPLLTYVDVDTRMIELRDAYLAAGIVTVKSQDDATHVATATLAGANLIVSWNFKHIVHFDKIRLYNEVNTTYGYPLVDIRSPLEVVYDEEEI